jgi:hypothetical protein
MLRCRGKVQGDGNTGSRLAWHLLLPAKQTASKQQAFAGDEPTACADSKHLSAL